ncbi:hypothetical protein HaLaN_31205, partial [Haematococcus lacustris]
PGHLGAAAGRPTHRVCAGLLHQVPQLNSTGDWPHCRSCRVV